MENELPPFTGEMCEWYDLPCHLTSFASWLFDVFLFIPRKVFELLMDGLAEVIEALPALDAITQASAGMSALSGMGYVADLVALREGIGLVLATLLARFLLRRIPVIG